MGRRALRKIDPKLDLSDYLCKFDDLPRPWDAAELFHRTAPLEVEVGSGKGLFLRVPQRPGPTSIFWASNWPQNTRLLPLPAWPGGLTNARIVSGDALRIFSELLEPNTLQAVHVYFPDPWWKTRHKKRRVLTEPFLRNAHRTLLPGGSLHFWTDVEEYFRTTLDLCRGLGLFEGPLEVPETAAEHDMDYRTHFERRTRQHGQNVFRSEFRKPL